MVKIKVCGLTRVEDAELALSLGADALGVVFQPNSPRCVAFDSEIVSWISRQSGFRRTAVMGVCAGRSIPEGFDAVQAVDVLGWTGPEQRWLAFRAGETELDSVSNELDGLLVDAYDPHQFGGTGQNVRLSDWQAVRERWNRDLWLAGGLTPENVAERILMFLPDGVDVASGVESSPGIKDHGRMTEFVFAVREVTKNLGPRE